MSHNAEAAAAVIALFLAAATPASAQRVADLKGFHLGAALNGSSIQLDDADLGDSDRESGAGINLYVGYNFTSNIGLFLSGTGASISSEDGDDFILGHGDLGVRLSFPGSSAFVPYIEAAYTALTAEDSFEGDKVELSGTGATGAAGFNYFFSQKLALDLNFRYTKGEFNTIKIGGQSISDDDGIGVSSGRFNIGIAWYPMSGR